MSSNQEIQVWDPLVRLLHWGLVGCFALAWLTGDEWLSLHVVLGYTLLAIVLLRTLWGFIGPRHARFSDFVYGPRRVLDYLRAIRADHPQRYIGHNPAGGAMVVALLLALLITGLSGLALYGATEFSGPLAPWLAGLGHDGAEWLEGLHEVAANATLLLALLHLGGVILASLQHDENLVRAMVTGRKRAPAEDDA